MHFTVYNRMIIMYKAYGMPYINAPLISLTYMNTAKVFRNITISQYMLILMAEEILFAVAVGLETVFASRHILKEFRERNTSDYSY